MSIVTRQYDWRLVEYPDRVEFLVVAHIGTCFLHMLYRMVLSISHLP